MIIVRCINYIYVIMNNDITVTNLVQAYKLLRALDLHKPVIVESFEFENPREVIALLNDI